IEQSGKKLSEKLISEIGKGPNELDLVRSGLDDTMRNAFQAIRERYWKEKKIKSYRTSAMSISIEKIYDRYRTMGVYP
ncbi:MAG: glutamate dehydrogenase, partial [Nitrospina sp.]|nr:glutamate dehydrogenase [Nitrospina sp.]